MGALGSNVQLTSEVSHLMDERAGALLPGFWDIPLWHFPVRRQRKPPIARAWCQTKAGVGI